MQAQQIQTRISDTPSLDNIVIHKCSLDQVEVVWPHVKNWLGRCLRVAPPWWRLEDLHQKCLSGDYIMWVILDNNHATGVALSELDQFPSAMVCNVPWIGGKNMKAWLEMLVSTVEAWASDAGVRWLAGFGREGWIRAAGMEKVGYLLVKDLWAENQAAAAP